MSKEFKVQEVEDYGSTIKVTVTKEIGNTVYSEKFGVSVTQYENGRWKDLVKKWINEIEARHSLDNQNIKKLEGEKLEVE